MISFSLPFPPSSNTYYRSIRMGNSCRVLLSKKGREYKKIVDEKIQALFLGSPGNFFPMQGRLECCIWLFPPNRRKFDIDNRIKPILDALQDSKVYEDDEAIDVLQVQRREIYKDGLVRIRLACLDEEGQPMIRIPDED